MQRLLFLCSGNYYRSRFAEIFFNWHAEQTGLLWRAESRGLALDPSNQGFMSRDTVARLAHHKIPMDAYQRLPLDVTAQDFASARHIVAVKEAEHRPLLQVRFPTWLASVEFWAIHDLDYARPQDAIPQLEREIMKLMDRLASGSRDSAVLRAT
jgi:protein-tyrosine phosphatase